MATKTDSERRSRFGCGALSISGSPSKYFPANVIMIFFRLTAELVSVDFARIRTLTSKGNWQEPVGKPNRNFSGLCNSL